MKSLKDIQKIITKFNVKPRPEMRSKVLDDALEIQRNRKQRSTSGIDTWRIIMKSKTTKFAAAAVIIIIIIGILFGVNLFDKVGTSVTFGEVLNNLGHVQTLHAILSKDGKKGEIWAKRPNMLRIENDDGTYEISNQSTMWTVDTVNNKATQGASWYFKSAQRQGLDVLDILAGMQHTEDFSGFFSEEPIGQIMQNGKIFDLYKTEINQYGNKIKFESLVYPETHLLYSMKTELSGAQGGNQVLEFTILEYDGLIADKFFVFEQNEGMQMTVEENENVEQPAEQAAGSQLSGRIVWASSEKPVGGAEITFGAGRTQSDGKREFFVRVPTNSDGYWLVKGVPAGQVDISVRSWELDWPVMPQFEGNSGSPKRPSIVVDGNSEYKGLDFKVYKPQDLFAHITISVKDEDGNALEGVSALLHYDEDNFTHQGVSAVPHKREKSGIDGKFDADDIWPTSRPVWISISKDGELGEVYATRGPLTEPFTIEPKGSYHFEVTLPFARKMQVQVFDKENRPIEGIFVSALDSRGLFFFPWDRLKNKAITNSEGLADVSGMAPGEDIIIVLKHLKGDMNDVRQFTASAIVHAKAPMYRDEHPTLKCVFDERPIYIKGSTDSVLREAKGRVNVMVGVLPGQQIVPFIKTRLDETGNFILSGVPKGKIRILFSYHLLPTEYKEIEGTMITEAGCTYTLKITDKGIEVINQEPNR